MRGSSIVRFRALAGIPVLAASASTALPGDAGAPPRITFEERVANERAVQQVYWSAREWPATNPGPKPPLSAVLGDAELRARVVDLLRKSAALESRWGRPVTAAVLEAEVRRMAEGTRAPETLRALFAALGDDPRRVAETLGRRAFVERAVRAAYARDPALHAEVRARAAESLAAVRAGRDPRRAGRYSERLFRLGSEAGATTREPGVVVLDQEGWDGLAERLRQAVPEAPPRSFGPLREDDDGFWTATVLERGEGLVRFGTLRWEKTPFDAWWGTAASSFPADAPAAEGEVELQAPSTDHSCATAAPWTPIAAGGWAPTSRRNFLSVSTGTEMIVFGGESWDVLVPAWTNSGALYDLPTDTWRPIPLPDPSIAAGEGSAVWTGSEMIVWGGYDYLGTGASGAAGARYDPVSDAWAPVGAAGAPTGRYLHTAVWTGTEMIVWGGLPTAGGPGVLDTGGRYDPVSDLWTPTTAGGTARYLHTAVWTGSRMIVWGGIGAGGGLGGPASLYDPVLDAWTASRDPLPGEDPPPSPRTHHSAVWTGTRMIVWGGENPASTTIKYQDGSRYDPAEDRWHPTSLTGAPGPRDRHSAVWNGQRMIVWAGSSGCCFHNDGGEYDPATDTWNPTFSGGAPAPRDWHAGVRSGDAMIVWGGLGTGSRTRNDGATYCACSYYRDLDEDGYGDPAVLLRDCALTAPPPGWVRDLRDCNDADPSVHPGVPDAICDGIDDNCSGAADEGYAPVETSCGVGACAATGATSCVAGTVVDSCTPGAPLPEVCDGVDNDCNGLADDPPSGVPSLTLVKAGDGTAQLGWTTLLSAASYDAVRGAVGALRSAGGDFEASTDACLADDTSEASATDGTDPPSGEGYWYLVRGVNCAGPGSYDTGAPSQVGPRDPGMAASPEACP